MTTRDLEPGIVTDLTNRLTYAGYLRLDKILSAQEPLSGTASAPPRHDELSTLLRAPSLYDEYLRHLARRGLPVPAACIERDWSQPYVRNPDLVSVFKTVYDNPDRWWDAYEMAEKLVDVEEGFQLWRFRHLKTVERTIGHKTGTGGSSGVSFLKRALDYQFFPELIDVRTVIGAKLADWRL